MQGSHFMEEEEFSLLVILKRVQGLMEVEKKSLNQVFELQDCVIQVLHLLN
jgi:hypothetical protein